MAILFPVLKPVSQMQLDSGSVVTIPQISWSEFESILQDLGEKRISRIAYSQNTLEIMVPLPEHEKPKDLISDLVKILVWKIFNTSCRNYFYKFSKYNL